MLLEYDIMFGCQTQESITGGGGMRMHPVVFIRYIRCAASSVMRKRVPSRLCGATKKLPAGPMVAGTRVPMIAARARYGAAERRHSYLFQLRGALRAAPQFSPEYLAFLAGKLAYARLRPDGHAVKELDGILPAIRNAELNAEISPIFLRDDPI